MRTALPSTPFDAAMRAAVDEAFARGLLAGSSASRSVPAPTLTTPPGARNGSVGIFPPHHAAPSTNFEWYPPQTPLSQRYPAVASAPAPRTQMATPVTSSFDWLFDHLPTPPADTNLSVATPSPARAPFDGQLPSPMDSSVFQTPVRQMVRPPLARQSRFTAADVLTPTTAVASLPTPPVLTAAEFFGLPPPEAPTRQHEEDLVQLWHSLSASKQLITPATTPTSKVPMTAGQPHGSSVSAAEMLRALAGDGQAHYQHQHDFQVWHQKTVPVQARDVALGAPFVYRPKDGLADSSPW